MKLPNGERAIVDDAKLSDYVLSPTHPVGRHHAALFARLLGIDLENAEVLKAALLSAACTADVDSQERTPFGRKFRLIANVSGPGGEKPVVSVWIIEEGSDRPRLVTCFVE
ncbi:MAG: hypothetical protein C4547_03385 [Phycisphaerales bacterium]|nr:MAG: hypothetical protein C4547_03385 [Phycisphaerales bacterium]